MKDIKPMSYPRGPGIWVTSKNIRMMGEDFSNVGYVTLSSQNIQIDVEEIMKYYKIALMKI